MPGKGLSSLLRSGKASKKRGGGSNTDSTNTPATGKRLRAKWNAWWKKGRPNHQAQPAVNRDDTARPGGADIPQEDSMTSSVRNGGSGAANGKPAPNPGASANPGAGGGGGTGGALVTAAQQYVDALKRIDTSTARGKQQYLEQLAEAKELIANADQRVVGQKLGELWGDENISAAFANQARAGRQMAAGIRNVLSGFRRRNREKIEHIDNPGPGHSRHGFDVSKNEGA